MWIMGREFKKMDKQDYMGFGGAPAGSWIHGETDGDEERVFIYSSRDDQGRAKPTLTVISSDADGKGAAEQTWTLAHGDAPQEPEPDDLEELAEALHYQAKLSCGDAHGVVGTLRRTPTCYSFLCNINEIDTARVTVETIFRN